MTALLTATDPAKKAEKLSIDTFEALVTSMAALGNRLNDFCKQTDYDIEKMVKDVDAFAMNRQQSGTELNKEIEWIQKQIGDKKELQTAYDEFTTLGKEIEDIHPTKGVYTSQPLQNFVCARIKVETAKTFIVQMPTGSGKSWVMNEYAYHVTKDPNMRVIIVTCNKALEDQFEQMIHGYKSDRKISVTRKHIPS